MKKVIILLLMASVGSSYGRSFYDAALKPAPTPAIVTVDTSKVAPVYVESVKQLKEAVPTIINSIRVLVPELIKLGGTAAAGDFSGLAMGAINLAAQSNTRDAIMKLIPAVKNTIEVSINLSKADPSTKKTVQDLLGAVSRDPDVTKLLALLKKVPGIGQDLHDKLQELIQLKI